MGGTGAGGPPEPRDEPGDGGTRNDRIEELRAELERLQARVAEEMAQQRRAAMKLQALLEEERHIARRARRQQRATRPRPDPPAEPGEGGAES